MAEILLSKSAITVYELLLILSLLIVLIWRRRKNRILQERRTINNRKMRNAQLEERLKNPNAKKEWSVTPNPYEIQYTPQLHAELQLKQGFQVEVEVHTQTSVQRFLFDLDQELTIGRDEKNVLPLQDNMVAQKNCSIRVKNGVVYVKNLSASNPVCIQRGKKKQVIQEQMVKLQNKDILFMGQTSLHIMIYQM